MKAAAFAEIGLSVHVSPMDIWFVVGSGSVAETSLEWRMVLCEWSAGGFQGVGDIVGIERIFGHRVGRKRIMLLVVDGCVEEPRRARSSIYLTTYSTSYIEIPLYAFPEVSFATSSFNSNLCR